MRVTVVAVLLKGADVFHQGASDFGHWQSLVSNSFVPLDTEPVGRSGRGRFDGRIEVQDCGSVAITQVTANPHAVLRTDELIKADQRRFYKVSYQLEGCGLLIQDGREVVLEPGALAIYDTSRPYTLSFDRHFSTYVMMFPHHRVNLPHEMVGQLTATRLGQDHHLGTVAGQLMAQAGAILPHLTDATGTRLAGNVVELLTTMMADQLDGTEGRGTEMTTTHRLLGTVTSYIEAHLPEADLTPGSIAAAHFISVRALHTLFEDAGETVSALIRRRRVERCRDDLADPLMSHVPVAQIGARWGLADPAHFSRLFRSVVGLSPAQYRHQTLTPVGSIVPTSTIGLRG